MDPRGFQRTHGQYHPVATLVCLKLLCFTALTRATCVQDSPFSMTVDLKNFSKVIVLGIKNI